MLWSRPNPTRHVKSRVHQVKCRVGNVETGVGNIKSGVGMRNISNMCASGANLLVWPTTNVKVQDQTFFRSE